MTDNGRSIVLFATNKTTQQQQQHFIQQQAKQKQANQPASQPASRIKIFFLLSFPSTNNNSIIALHCCRYSTLRQ